MRIDSLDFRKLNDWVPTVLIFAGIGLTWLGVDKYSIVVSCGFFAYGLLGLIDSKQRNYHKHLSLKMIKIFGQLMILALAVYNFIAPVSLVFMFLLILSDRIILTPNRLDKEDTQ